MEEESTEGAGGEAQAEGVNKTHFLILVSRLMDLRAEARKDAAGKTEGRGPWRVRSST